MSIIVRDIKMPENCWHYPFQYDLMYCSVKHCIKITAENEEERDKRYPLFQVKAWEEV